MVYGPAMPRGIEQGIVTCASCPGASQPMYRFPMKTSSPVPVIVESVDRNAPTYEPPQVLPVPTLFTVAVTVIGGAVSVSAATVAGPDTAVMTRSGSTCVRVTVITFPAAALFASFDSGIQPA